MNVRNFYSAELITLNTLKAGDVVLEFVPLSLPQ